jgi:hypothetical protein
MVDDVNEMVYSSELGCGDFVDSCLPEHDLALSVLLCQSALSRYQYSVLAAFRTWLGRH